MLAIPVGNGGNITAYWRGFLESAERGEIDRARRACWPARPKAPRRSSTAAPSRHPETVASAIRIGRPVRYDEAREAITRSEGLAVAIPDDAILDGVPPPPAEEGVFCEPASAASLAGLVAALERGEIARGSRVVCVLTGHGLKDPDTAIANAVAPVQTGASYGEIEAAILGDA